VIVTKNRKDKLALCVKSLIHQSCIPDEVIIIDNGSTDGSPEMIHEIKKRAKFPIHCYEEPRAGYPIIYNRGLKEAHFPWVALIDNDCVASPDWLHEIKKTIETYPRSAAVLGYSWTINSQNPYSLCTQYNIQLWKKGGIKGKRVVDLEILDNKNIAYNKVFLQRHHLTFNENLSTSIFGAFEDCDLGMQIQQAGGEAIYQSRIEVAHHDPTTWSIYVKKVTNSAFSYMNFEKKWLNFRKSLPQKRYKNNFRKALQFAKQQRLHPAKICVFLFLLYVTYGYTKILRLIPDYFIQL